MARDKERLPGNRPLSPASTNAGSPSYCPARVADAKLRLRALAQSERRDKLKELTQERKNLHRELRQISQQLRARLSSAERCLLKEREHNILARRAVSAGELAHQREQQASDAALTALSHREMRAQEARKEERWGSLLAAWGNSRGSAPPSAPETPAKVAEYAQALRDALYKHRRCGVLQLPDTPRSSRDGNEATVSPQRVARMALRGSAAEKEAERRRDPADGRYKLRRDFLRSGHGMSDWRAAETLTRRRARRRKETHLDWERRKEMERRSEGRAFFAIEKKLKERAQTLSPGARGAGSTRAELLRSAVSSGTVAMAMRASGLRGVRALVTGLLGADQPADESAGDPEQLVQEAEQTPSAPAVIAHEDDTLTPSPPSQPATARPGTKGSRGSNPFAFRGGHAGDASQLPDGWPAPPHSARSKARSPLCDSPSPSARTLRYGRCGGSRATSRGLDTQSPAAKLSRW